MRELSELVEAAQAGDSEAYGALIQRFQQMAYATAYTYALCEFLAHRRARGPSQLIVTEAVPTAG